MSKSQAILLSLVLSLSSSGAAFAQYQDPALNGPGYVNDGLETIYDQINARAKQGQQAQLPQQPQQPLQQPQQAAVQKPLNDPRAYEQFMHQTAANLDVEHTNTATLDAARQRDAVITGAYEQKRIMDQSKYDRANATANTRHGRIISGQYLGTMPGAGPDATPIYEGIPVGPNYRSLDEQRELGILRSQENVNNRLQNSADLARSRDESMVDAANNLRDQVLSTQSLANKFGLQGVGTNLYVRQYGKPDANLPPVHNAAARIVPVGSDY
jgi:hypothetical protein